MGTHPLTEHTCDYAGCWCHDKERAVEAERRAMEAERRAAVDLSRNELLTLRDALIFARDAEVKGEIRLGPSLELLSHIEDALGPASIYDQAVRVQRSRRIRGTPRTRAVNRCADALERIAQMMESGHPATPEPTKTREEPPPIGVQPKYTWEAARMHDLMCAICRYKAAGLNPRPEWEAELDELRP